MHLCSVLLRTLCATTPTNECGLAHHRFAAAQKSESWSFTETSHYSSICADQSTSTPGRHTHPLLWLAGRSAKKRPGTLPTTAVFEHFHILWRKKDENRRLAHFRALRVCPRTGKMKRLAQPELTRCYDESAKGKLAAIFSAGADTRAPRCSHLPPTTARRLVGPRVPERTQRHMHRTGSRPPDYRKHEIKKTRRLLTFHSSLAYPVNILTLTERRPGGGGFESFLNRPFPPPPPFSSETRYPVVWHATLVCGHHHHHNGPLVPRATKTQPLTP